MKKKASSRFVLCVNNDGYPASLEVCKVYRRLPDRAAEAHKLSRVIDESGEDYLYPESLFVAIDLPPSARPILAKAVSRRR
jgi:hypothetical protein